MARQKQNNEAISTNSTALVHTDAKWECALACVREDGDPGKQSWHPSSFDPDLLADVLAGENLPAGLALEAAQMPLFVQS